MREKKFFVKTGTQNPLVNRLLRSADLACGAIIPDGSGFNVSVQWKDGEIVDAQRIAKTQQNLQRAFEVQGYCILGIERAGK